MEEAQPREPAIFQVWIKPGAAVLDLGASGRELLGRLATH
jgi:hypothetical protein